MDRLLGSDASAREAELLGGSLPEFVRAAWPVLEPGTPYLSNWHIDAVSEYLEAVTAGQITRLLVNMPPRYGKSILISVMWPVWEWIRRPETRWLFASYSGSLSVKHSVDRRTVIRSDWYQERWGDRYRLAGDQNAKAEFLNDRRGVMVATSIGGTATGKGGDRLVVDDPHSPIQAESEVKRAAAINFFDRTLCNRLDDKRRGAVVVVMQRLHQEDLSARCIDLGYTHLKLPAVANERTVVRFPSGREVVREAGSVLWPGREGPAEIADARKTLGSYGFSGQYEQEPSPIGGGLFQPGWFGSTVDAVPVHSAYIRYWDKAGTQGAGAYTAGVLMARSPEGMYYVVDVVRGQWSAGERERRIRQTAEQDGFHVAIWIEQEPGSGGKESAQNTVLNLAGWNARAEPVTGDKVARARPFAAQAEAMNVRLVRDAPSRRWNAAFLDELGVFPTGTFKDQVDAASGAFNKLALATRPGPSAVAGRRPGLAESTLWSARGER